MDKNQNNKILIISTKQLTGGSIYEHLVYDILKERYSTDLLALNPIVPKYIPGRKLRFVKQLLPVNYTQYHTIIANVASVKALIKINKVKNNILILHHIEHSNGIKYYLDYLLNNYLINKLKYFNSIVTVSEYWKKYLTNYLPPDKIRVIKNSYDIEKIKSIINNFDEEEYKKKYSIPKNKIIIYGGNSLKNKGVVELNKILKKNKYHLITSGRKDIDCGNMHLTLSYEDYLRLLKICDVTILLSKYEEGWNRIAHESILCGTPVIGNNTGGLGELIAETKQYYYDEFINIDSLIDKVLTNYEDNQFGRIIAERYNLEYFKYNWLTLINTIDE